MFRFVLCVSNESQYCLKINGENKVIEKGDRTSRALALFYRDKIFSRFLPITARSPDILLSLKCGLSKTDWTYRVF